MGRAGCRSCAQGVWAKLGVTIRRVLHLFDLHAALGAMFCCFFEMNCPGFVEGSNFQVGWSRYKQDGEQVFP